VTAAGAVALLKLVAEDACDENPAAAAVRDGHAAVLRSNDGAGDVPSLRRKTRQVTPAAAIKSAATSLLSARDAASASVTSQIPTRWEKLGDLALLPSSSFSDETVWTSDVRTELWPLVAAALGVGRLAKQAEVSRGPKRESRAVMVYDPKNIGGWVELKENGVIYTLDVTKVMFSSGNGTEKHRMSTQPAAGETVVDLYAGIGYYTLQLLKHAGVSKVYACEWNPNSVAALRKNLVANEIDERRCEVLEGDNNRTAPRGVADRVLLGLLPDSERAWPTAVAALRPETGGVMHVHGNVASGEEDAWARRLEREVAEMAATAGMDWAVRVEHVEKVKWYAPRVRHVVADVRCAPRRLATAWAVGVNAATSPRSSLTIAGEGKMRARRNPEGAAVAVAAAHSCRAPPLSDGTVRRMHRPTERTFRGEGGPVRTRVPCVLTGLDLGPAPWLWSPAHLAAKPSVAAADVSVHVCDSPHLDFVRKNFKYEVMKFGDLLESLSKETTTTGEDAKKTWLYLRSIGKNPRKEAAHALEQFPDLKAELKLPSDLLWGADDDDAYFSTVMRCSSGGTRLWTHYDAMDNALVQLHGEKRVLLFPPSAAAGLYLSGSSSPVVGPFVDGDGGVWPTEQYPAYERARRRAVEVILQPGDVLFIPALWSHHVESLHGPSVAMNVFFRELPRAAYPSKDLYGNADPIAAGKALEMCESAAKELASLPRDHKVFYGGVAAAKLLRDLRVETDVMGVTPGGSGHRTRPELLPGKWADAAKGAALAVAIVGAVSVATAGWKRAP
jgi:tRNA wybutosine-synthesizing protein 3